jgi:hypothetical protein
MTSAQRKRPRRPAPAGPDPASRGFILVIVAFVLGAILLAAGGTVGFDQDDESVDIGEGGEPTETTAAPVETTAAPSVEVAPADVKVVVANGAGISGLASETGDFLATQGYTNTVATDAPGDVALTAVYYAEGFQANAEAIGAMFNLPPEQIQPLPAEPVANDQPVDAAVILVLGPDAEAIVSGTTTTVAGDAATTTTSGDSETDAADPG